MRAPARAVRPADKGKVYALGRPYTADMPLFGTRKFALRIPGATEARALLLTSGDHRKRIEWDPAVVESAARHDLAIDANGHVAPKRFVDRAQR